MIFINELYACLLKMANVPEINLLIIDNATVVKFTRTIAFHFNQLFIT